MNENPYKSPRSSDSAASPIPAGPNNPSPRNDAANAVRGYLMGAADIVPGVSGGTVALVLGVYHRLLTAISRFDGAFVGHVAGFRWRDALTHIDARFLAALGGGILLGVVSLAGLMHYLLEHHMAATYAGFFGLILASSVIVWRMASPMPGHQMATSLTLAVFAATGAFALLRLGVLQPREGLLYTFVCGAIAICAMILPGVSGSYLLVMLGKYHEITGLIKGLPKGEVTGEGVVTIAVFACGCAVGLLAFSKLLRWLLDRYWTGTMATLAGFMIGSLYRIWPFQIDTTPEVEKFKHKRSEPIWPEALDGHVALCLTIAVAAFALVIAIDRWGRRSREP